MVRDLGTIWLCFWPYAYRRAGTGPGVIPPGCPNFVERRSYGSGSRLAGVPRLVGWVPVPSGGGVRRRYRPLRSDASRWVFRP